MAVSCPWCRSFDIGAHVDGFQCFSCGGYMHMDGTPTVPTSAIETEDALWDGPGREMVDDPDNPPFKARNAVKNV